jgi:hypothetical protein
MKVGLGQSERESKFVGLAEAAASTVPRNVSADAAPAAAGPTQSAGVAVSGDVCAQPKERGPCDKYELR